jgi:hypothetical protein
MERERKLELNGYDSMIVVEKREEELDIYRLNAILIYFAKDDSDFYRAVRMDMERKYLGT